MAGSAGGALQTGQRIGSAVGTAALPALFYVVLSARPDGYRLGAVTALGAALLFVACALVIGLVELSRDRHRAAADARDDPAGRPEHAAAG